MSIYQEIAKMIDHSLLQPYLTHEEMIKGCEIAKYYEVASVCVRPCDVRDAAKVLKESSVLVSTVIGFPHGTTTTHTKLEEATQAMIDGAVELDVVLNIGKMKSGDYIYVEDELRKIIAIAHAREAKVKVIFENCYLTDEEIIIACEICNKVNADWVKTSTGYGTSGAEDHHLKLMRKHANPEVQVKAAGGIRTAVRALQVKELGVTRIGSTATVDILEALKE